MASDPVTHFHARNGAALYRLNWKGDISQNGMAQSYGIMANYIYILKDMKDNHARYLIDGRVPVHESFSL